MATTRVGLEVDLLVKNSRDFLRKFGVDESRYSDDEVLEKIEKIREVQSENVQVLSRGDATDQIKTFINKIPRGLIGEFVPDRPIDIERRKALGWIVFLDEEAASTSPTGASDSVIRLADCILMVIPEEKLVAQRMGQESHLQDARLKRDPKRAADEAGKDSSLSPILNFRK